VIQGWEFQLHRFFLSTVMLLSLPFDILEIIAVTVHESETKRYQGLNSPVFSRVSKGTREIALQIPRLWSTIYFPGPKLRKGHLYTARVHAERSCGHPLSVTVFTVRFNADIMDFIIPLAPRWRYIDFRGPFKFFETLEVAVKDNLQQLETCVVEVDTHKAFSGRERSDPASTPSEFLFLQNAPSLRHFFQHNLQYPYFLVPLNNLVSFHATGFSETVSNPTALMHIPLRTCFSSSLVTLSCVVHPILSITPTLPNLRRLSLNIHSLPYYSRYTEMVSTVDSFLSKNGSGVENLTLFNARYVNPDRPAGTLRRWLGYCPGVLVFTHLGYSLSKFVLQSLIVCDRSDLEGESNANVLPRLHTFRIIGEHQGSGSILIQMLASRGWIGSPLGGEQAPAHSDGEFKCLKAVYAGSIDELDFEFFCHVNQHISSYRRNGFHLETGVTPYWSLTAFAKRRPLGGEMFSSRITSLI